MKYICSNYMKKAGTVLLMFLMCFSCGIEKTSQNHLDATESPAVTDISDLEVPEFNGINKLKNLDENWYFNEYLMQNGFYNVEVKEYDDKFEIYFDDDNNPEIVAALEDENIHLSLNLPYEFEVKYQKDNVDKAGTVKFNRELNDENLYDFQPYNFSLLVNEKWVDMYYYKNNFYYLNHKKIDFGHSLHNKLIDKLKRCNAFDYSLYGYFMEKSLGYFKIVNSIKQLNEAENIIPDILIESDKIVNYSIGHDLLYYGVDGLWGIIDNTNQEIIAPPVSYDMPYSLNGVDFKEIVYENKEYSLKYGEYFIGGFNHGFIDTQLFVYDNDLYTITFPDDGFFTDKYDRIKYPIENLTGYFLASSTETSLENGTVYAVNTGKYGIADKNGNIIKDAIYDDVFNVKGEIIPVMKNGCWGYVNDKGEEVIPTEYQPVMRIRFGHYYPYPENGGYVVLKNKDNKFGVMDVHGKVIKDFIYDWGLPYKNGYMLRYDGTWNYYE